MIPTDEKVTSQCLPVHPLQLWSTEPGDDVIKKFLVLHFAEI